MTGPASTAAFGTSDSSTWVTNVPVAGTKYRFTAWVMSDSNSGSAKLRIKEYNGGVQRGATTYSPAVTLTPGWQMVTVDYIAAASGSNINLQIINTPVTTNEVFRTDNISTLIVP